MDELGLFSGWVPEDGAYEVSSWGYEGTDGELTAGKREQTGDVSGDQAHGAHGMKLEHGEPPEQDWTLEHPNCVFQILKRHFARYTPEMVEEVCGVPREKLLQVAETLCRNSGRERTARSATRSAGPSTRTACRTSAPPRSSSCCSATSAARAAASSRCAATPTSRARPTSRRCTTSCPATSRCRTRAADDDLDKFVELNGPDTGAWGELKSYCREPAEGLVGRRGNAGEQLRLPYLPRIDGDHSHYPMMLRMIDGETKGLHRHRPEPGRRLGQLRAAAQGAREPRLARRARHDRDRDRRVLVRLAGDRDRRAAARGHRHRGVLPAGRGAHREGRHVHEHAAPAAVAFQGRRAAAGLPLGPVVHLPARPAHAREARRLAGPERPADPRPRLGLPDAGPAGRARRRGDHAGDQRPPRRRHVRRQVPGARRTTGRRRAARGSTPASTPTASTRRRARSRAASRTGSRRSGAGRGPATGASSTTARRPTRRASPGRSASATSGGTPSRSSGRARRRPGLRAGQGARTTSRPRTPRGWTRSAASSPFIVHPDGLGWLYAPSGLVDGPLPTHYEPHESPFDNPLYARAGKPDAPDLRPARRTRTTRPAGSPAPTCSRSSSRPTGSPSTTPPAACRAACPTSPSCSRRCSARSARSSPPSAASSTAAGRRSSRRAPRSRRACSSPSASGR